jgi:hypothetical protein
VGGEDYGGLAVGGADGEDVPGVGGDDEGGEEVELVGAVDDVAGADGTDVGVAALVDSALHLNTAEEAVVVGGDVVGGGFSPGLVAAESALAGALHETEFGPLSAEFGVLDVFALIGDVMEACGDSPLWIELWWGKAGSSPGFGARFGMTNLLYARNDRVL